MVDYSKFATLPTLERQPALTCVISALLNTKEHRVHIANNVNSVLFVDVSQLFRTFKNHHKSKMSCLDNQDAILRLYQPKVECVLTTLITAMYSYR